MKRFRKVQMLVGGPLHLQRWFLLAGLLVFLTGVAARAEQPKQDVKHYLYVATPGIRNDLQLGGAGLLVFDMDHGHQFVKRIETPASREEKPDNLKGVCASAATKKLYFTTTKKLYCVDLVTNKTLWEKALPQGCDRPSITPDGKLLYVPSFEKNIWNIVAGTNGAVVATIETKSGSHNTVVGLDGSRMYLAGLRSPLLSVADTRTHKVVKTVGPFAAPIRPFTVNAAQTLCFVTVNGLLGFEIGDLKTGKKLYRVEIVGVEKGPVKRHGCPSHGIGLTPDEKEIWVCDGHNSRLHVFDATVMPPKQGVSIKLRDQPGWVTFSLDGRYAYPSTGEVIDVKTKKIVAALTDEKNRAVHSEKMVEIDFKDGVPVRTGDQFGVGRASTKQSRERESSPPKPPAFQVPKGWQVIEAAPFASARFQIGKGKRTATVVVAGLAGEAGGLAANVSRYRRQVGLGPVAEKDVLKSLQPIKVDGSAGHSLDLTGPEVIGKTTLRIRVVIVTRGEQTWFFKLMGPASLVGEQVSAFEKFIQSVRFEK